MLTITIISAFIVINNNSCYYWGEFNCCKTTVGRLMHLQAGVNIQRESKNPPRFSDIFPKRLGIFSASYVPIHARLQIVIQLSPTLTKLCHCYHPACVSADDGHFGHI